MFIIHCDWVCGMMRCLVRASKHLSGMKYPIASQEKSLREHIFLTDAAEKANKQLTPSSFLCGCRLVGRKNA